MPRKQLATALNEDDPPRTQSLPKLRSRVSKVRRPDEVPSIRPIPMQPLDEEAERQVEAYLPKEVSDFVFAKPKSRLKIDGTPSRLDTASLPKQKTIAKKDETPKRLETVPLSIPEDILNYCETPKRTEASKKMQAPKKLATLKKIATDLTDSKKSVPKKEPSKTADPSNPTCRLGLLVVYNYYKAAHILNRIPGSKMKKTPRHRAQMTVTTNGLVIKHSSASTAGGNVTSLRKEDMMSVNFMIRELKFKFVAYYNRQTVRFNLDGRQIEMTKSVSAYKAAYLRAFTGKRPNEDPEYFPWRGLRKLMQVALNTHISWDELFEGSLKWHEVERNPQSKALDKPASEIAKKLGITLKQFNQFDLYPDPDKLFARLKKRPFYAFVPDIMKQLAFSCWLKKEYEKCLYYLTETHATLLKRRISDKHHGYFCKLEENGRSLDSNVASEHLKKTLFTMQLSDLKNFNSSLEQFPVSREMINPKWHVVQLSSIFHSDNRFGASIGGYRNAPAMFLSAFTTINGEKKRYCSIEFLEEPKLNPAVTKMNIYQHYESLMAKNRKINDHQRDEVKNRYWEIRAEHNEHMRYIVRFMEEDWITRWNFLFPGNVLDGVTIEEIRDALNRIKRIYPAVFTDRVAGVVYKLVENFNYLTPENKKIIQIQDLLQHILNVPKCTKKLTECAEIVVKVGHTIIVNQPRSPTILILDQDLEKYPWECMECLRDTDVTRAPSLSMIFSLTRINNHPLLSPEVDVNSCNYVLNPDGSLLHTQDRLHDYFKRKPGWSGWTQVKPTSAEFEKLIEEKDLLVYCGHGNGTQFLPESILNRGVCRSVPLLMGCGSTKFNIPCPQSYGHSVVNTYFTAMCRSIVGFLWEITDMECDRITADIIERISPSARDPLPRCFLCDKDKQKRAYPYTPNLARCVRLSRDAASQFMTQAAIVNYGIPLTTTMKPRLNVVPKP